MNFVVPAEVSSSNVVGFLREQKGIEVIHFCMAHNAVYAIVDVYVFKSEDELQRLIEVSFPGVACFKKNCSDEALNDFFRMCYEEIVKPIE